MEKGKSHEGNQAEYLCFAVTRRRLADLVGLGGAKPAKTCQTCSVGQKLAVAPGPAGRSLCET